MDKEKVSQFVDSVKKMAEELGLECVIAVIDNKDNDTTITPVEEPLVTFGTLYQSLTHNVGTIGPGHFKQKLVDISCPGYPPYVVDVSLDDREGQMFIDPDVKWVLNFGIKSRSSDIIDMLIATVIVTSDRMRNAKEFLVLIPDKNGSYINVNDYCNIGADTPIDHPNILQVSTQHLKNVISCLREIELDKYAR